MRTALPPITDHTDALTHRLPREHDGHKKPRLQMLYLLASGQSRTRQDVAHLLRVHRTTIGRWLAIYVAAGLDALLAIDVLAGKPVSLAPAVLASLDQALQRPEGFASSEALRRWVRQTHGVEVKDQTLYALVRTRFRAKRNVPRPSHTEKPEAIPEFQATCREHLPRVIPPENRRPVRVLSQDESRFGWLTARRRRLTACGVQPVGLIPHVFEWFDVYGAVAPTTGERCFLERPYLNADLCQIFIDALAHAFPASVNGLLLDNSGAPTAQGLRWPENVRYVWLPPTVRS